MKNFLMTLSLVFCTPNLWANTSTSGTRGGGNMEVAAFYAKAQGILNSLLTQSPLVLADTKLDIQGLINKLAAVKVEAVQKQLKIGQAAVDAINYPDRNLIQFNKDRWLKLSGAEQAQLVIHELLGVSRIADPNYKLSSAVITYIGSDSGYDNRGLGGGEPCEETRPFSGDKAKHLVRALAIAKVKNFKLPKLNCRVATEEVVGADEPSVMCDPVGDDLATAQVLADALEFIGIWGEGGMSHISYGAENIGCTADAENDIYKCSLKAYWDWSCPAP
jgi:hypothetical protein